MDEYIEKVLNVTNFQDHPTNNTYKVFHFIIKEQADYFIELLNENNISFESDEEFAKGNMTYLFGIHKSDLNKVMKLNYLALGKYRKPLIKNNVGKWFVVIFGIVIFLFALISFFMTK